LLNNSTENVISALNKARSRSLASLDSSTYGVYFESSSNKVIIFKGTSYNSTASGNETINLGSETTLSTTPLTTNIYFERLNGKPNTTVDIRITIQGPSNSKTITISPTGAISF
jgi:hypothetical protein